MTSDRPYQRALHPDGALAELRRCAGTQFDPEVVAAFEALMAAGLERCLDPASPAAPAVLAVS